jgi:hypothetical protein
MGFKLEQMHPYEEFKPCQPEKHPLIEVKSVGAPIQQGQPVGANASSQVADGGGRNPHAAPCQHAALNTKSHPTAERQLVCQDPGESEE